MRLTKRPVILIGGVVVCNGQVIIGSWLRLTSLEADRCKGKASCFSRTCAIVSFHSFSLFREEVIFLSRKKQHIVTHVNIIICTHIVRRESESMLYVIPKREHVYVVKAAVVEMCFCPELCLRENNKKVIQTYTTLQ